MKNRSIKRRAFLRATGAGLAAPMIAPALGQAGSTAKSGKLHHACIGVGGMGMGDLKQFVAHAGTEVVAICDVDSQRLRAARKFAPKARTYGDWRELLEKEAERIDSVNVTVPDHMHAPIAMTAMRMGKHVYCQKPMCHDVAEVRALTEMAKKQGLVTQLGTQHASGIGDRMAVQFLRQGVIGKVKHLYLCSNRPSAVNFRLAGPRPSGEPAPEHLDWEKWIGTAPMRDYAPNVYHPAKWRCWQDFGTGWSGDIGCHIFDAVWKGLGLTPPKSVVSKVQESWKNTPKRFNDTWPQGDHISWVFPGNEMTEGDEVVAEWFDGDFYPPEEIRKIHEGKIYPAESAMIVGTDGSLLLPHTSGPILYPRAKYLEIERPKLPARNHYHHFADACLGKEKNESSFEQTGAMTEAILLGTVANRVPDTLLEWDAAGMKIPNNATANALLKRSYREGWEVEGL